MPTTHPTAFDFGDPEFWEIRGVPSPDCDEVAKSSPFYWMGAYGLSQKDASHLSRPHRQRAYDAILSALELPWTRSGVPHTTMDDDGYHAKEFLKLLAPGHGMKMWHDVLSFAAELFKKRRRGDFLRAPDPEFKRRRRLQDGTFLQAGPRLCDQRILQSVFPDHGARWGPLRFGDRRDAVAHHYCVVGVPRSGKTVLIRLLLESLDFQRAIIYDDKTNVLSQFPIRSDSVYILNPFDRRCAAWDIAKDADSSHRTGEIARLLVPDAPNQNPYFANTARQLLAGVMDALNAIAPGKWSFLDLLICAQSINIRHVLSQHEPGRALVIDHLNATDQTERGVLSTLQQALASYRPVAAAWSHTPTRISLTDWVRNSPADLVLGNHDAHKAAMSAINRVFFQLLAESLLDVLTRPVLENPTFIILDELEQLGTLESLEPLMNKGTSLGITLVLGFHDIQTLRRYYREATNGIVTMCGHYAFLRVNNPETARWASDLMGHQEVLIKQQSKTTSKDQESETTSHRHTERPLVRPTELQHLPLTHKHSGLRGYFKSICHPTYRGSISGKDLFGPDGLISDSHSGTPNQLTDFEPHPKEHFLWPNDTSDPLARLAPEEEPKNHHKPRDDTKAPSARPAQFAGPRANDQINTSPVRVLDETGEEIGILPTDEATQLAHDRGLDLTLVEPPGKNQPAVCEITHAPTDLAQEPDASQTETTEASHDDTEDPHEWDPQGFDRLELF